MKILFLLEICVKLETSIDEYLLFFLDSSVNIQFSEIKAIYARIARYKKSLLPLR